MQGKRFIGLTLGAWLGLCVLAQDAPRKLPFSAARKAGNTLYVSGHVARDENGKDVKESIAAETHQIMKNIGRVLKQHGYDYDDIVRATVYLKDLGDYAEMNGAYATYFKGEYPARACVGADLVLGFKVEISVIAYKEP